MTHAARWDVFCRVIDHFGDAGVSFRLARQLVAEYGYAVTLWIDRPEALAGMVPGFAPEAAMQIAAGVTVRRWTDPLPAFVPADVVVNAFVAGLPDAYVDAMAATDRPPRWIELEYLSPDPAFDVHHLQASPHPRLPLPRTYWVPGFSANAGGLLRERDLLDRRDRFVGDVRAQAQFRQRAQLSDFTTAALRVSMFSYPHAPAATLAEAMRDGPADVLCAIPMGDPFGDHAADDRSPAGTESAGSAASGTAQPHASAHLTVIAYPFLPQDDFDRLLWTCDVNFVRGEDSFVRALWAGKPLVWLAYPQEPDTHYRKLGAFLDWYTDGLGAAAAEAYRAMTMAWNWRASGAQEPAMRRPESDGRARASAAEEAAMPRPESDGRTPATGADASNRPIAFAWRNFVAALPDLRDHAARIAARRAREPDLLSRLVRWVETGL